MQQCHRSRTSRILRGALALATASAVVVVGLPGAAADETDPTYPSTSEVEAAQARVRSVTRSVEAIRSDLAAAAGRLDDLAIEAAKAAEAYNGAVWRLEQAREEAIAARRSAVRQAAVLDDQRGLIAALVADTYQGASSFAQLNAYLTSDDPDALLSRVSAYRGVSESLAVEFDRFSARDVLARAFRDRARQAVVYADEAAAEAERARQNAAAAVAAQEQAVVSLGERRDALIQELARAQDVSVDLARQRQEALERIEAQRRARVAAADAEAERQADARAQADAERTARQTAGDQPATAAPAAKDGPTDRPASDNEPPDPSTTPPPDPSPRPDRDPDPSPAPASPPRQSSGAHAAVDFAYAQLGEPYRWGAEGPDAWDCSGLTKMAWRAGGGSLTHYSVAQYYETSRVSYSQLRAGDLIFWSDDGSPGGIFHVALYIGGGRMIHAPRTGVPVSIDSVWYWRAPSFYGRV